MPDTRTAAPAAAPGAPGAPPKRRGLFLCTGNSARSQMAEGWLRRYAVFRRIRDVIQHRVRLFVNAQVRPRG
jgi:hypothetical protein